MNRAKRTLALLALTTLVGCSNRLQPATPPQGETTLQIYSTYATTPLVTTLTSLYMETHPEITFEYAVANHQTMLNRLMAGDMPYFVSNHLSAESALSLWAAPLAQDGLVIITGLDNLVTNLNMEELRRIYRGYITNWEEVGGADLDIVLYSRESGSGTRAEFERLVMGQQRTSPNAQIVPSIAAMLASINTEPGAVGYVPLSQLTDSVKVLSIDNIQPSLTTISSNSYPLRSTLYIIGLSEADGAYRAFVAWAQGMEGQMAIRSQYAPLP